jgi:phosphoribosylformylglycinamidine synthase
LVGATRNELAGSHYAEVIDPDWFDHLLPHAEVPKVDTVKARTTMHTLGDAIRRGMVRACHDLSEGGLAVAAAEMSLAGEVGATINLEQVTVKDSPTLRSDEETIVRLFGETPSRFLVEITPEQFGAFEKHMQASGVEDITYVGTVNNSSRFIVKSGEEELINVSVAKLQKAWKGEQFVQ